VATTLPVPHARRVLVAVVLGGLVSLLIGVYGSVHQASGRDLALFGFPTMIEMKVWLGLVAGGLALAQLVTALWMFGRLGLPVPGRLGLVHRSLGLLAVVVSLPVAYACLWSLGFQSQNGRVLVHSLFGCLLYGVVVVKLVGLHVPSAPRWLVPVAGGLLFVVLVSVVLTSAVWFLATFGAPPG
jgi:hypothetical protein